MSQVSVRELPESGRGRGAKDTLATKHDILMLRQEMHHEIPGVRSELRQEMAELRGELKAEVHASASSIVRQMYGSLLGQMAVLLGIAYFFVTHVV